MDIDTYAWLRGSKYRLLFLRILSLGPMLPSELASRFKINRSSASRTLSELERHGLITKSTTSSRTVAYTATEKGKHFVKYASEVKANYKEEEIIDNH